VSASGVHRAGGEHAIGEVDGAGQQPRLALAALAGEAERRELRAAPRRPRSRKPRNAPAQSARRIGQRQRGGAVEAEHAVRHVLEAVIAAWREIDALLAAGADQHRFAEGDDDDRRGLRQPRLLGRAIDAQEIAVEIVGGLLRRRHRRRLLRGGRPDEDEAEQQEGDHHLPARRWSCHCCQSGAA